jgi:Asp-tRNA(Asn)/Glu-tRNA(Gln) amidotransferase B subunit
MAKLTAASIAKSVSDFYKSNADSDAKLTATQLTALVQLVTDNSLSEASAAKTVRGFMRSMKLRDQSEYRGASWRIIETQAVEVVTHFARNLIAS